MTTRNFDALFAPKSIALIGASNQPGSVGAVLARNLLGGGFRGPIMTVNPHEAAILSTLNYHSVAELPAGPDLAVIATPAAVIPQLIAALAARGCRAAIVITAGFEGPANALREAMFAAATPSLLRIMGPNCLGFLSPQRGINASFAHLTPKAGSVAFATQSGAIATTMLDWAVERDLGFSHVLSLGDMCDVDFGDVLDYLALDPETHSILLYVETITHARKFMSAARIAARAKPVIVVKAGRSAGGAAAALSHTGALAGSDAVYDAAFRRAGLLRVTELRDLFDAASTLATGVRVDGDRLTILTNGGGLGVLAADALESQGGRLSELTADVRGKLDRLLPKTWSRRNPVDILGDANRERYGHALEALLADPGGDAILVMNCPTGVVDGLGAAEAVIACARKPCAPPILTCWVGQATAAQARRKFSASGIPAFETPDEAVKGFMQLVDYQKNQELLLETPAAAVSVSSEACRAARDLIARVLSEGRSVLTAPEAKSVLETCGIPVVRSLTAKDPVAAAAAAREIGGTVALKILSPDITHKSDVGGVRLHLSGDDMVRAAAEAMLRSARQKAPGARLSGFAVEPMVEPGRSHELIVGLAEDATFGPVLLFGQGGVAVEVLADRAMGLPPLNSVLAREMIARTRVAKLLKGYRDVPPANLDAITAVLVRISEMVVQIPELVELDINPLIADAVGARALDARIVVRSPPAGAERRLAIRPYPAELESALRDRSGGSYRVRPIRPEDEAALIAMVERCTPEDRSLRFLGALTEVTHAMAARLTQIDYDREMALVAFGADEICGVVRLACDPNFESGEYAILVRSDLKGRGLGFALMREMLAYARSRGLSRVVGDVREDNRRMLDMAAELGAEQHRTMTGTVRVTIPVSN